MGPDHPENTSKPRRCLPKPAKAGTKLTKARAKPAKSGAKPAQNGVLPDRNRPYCPYRPVRCRRDAQGMDDHSPGRQWRTRPSGGHHRDRIFRQGSRLPDAPAEMSMGYRPRLATLACPRASNFADAHVAVGTGVTAGVGHDATRPTPNLPDAHVTVAMGF